MAIAVKVKQDNLNGENQISVLDSLRGFAALSVCLYHFVCTTTGFIHNQWILDFFSFGKNGVQLFFVISGFIIPWSMQKAGYRFADFFTFLLKRLARLEPPYIVSLVVAILILIARQALLGSSENLQPITLNRVLLHFGYLIPFFENYEWINQVYWTLAIEFQYYLFVGLIFIPLIKWGIVSRIIIYILFLSAHFISDSHFLPYWLPVFLLGVLTFMFKAKQIGKVEYCIVLANAIILCAIVYQIGEVFFMLMPVVAILFFSGFNFKVGNFLGQFSYSLYLIHPIIGATVINVLSHHVQQPFGKVIVILLGIIFTLVSSWIMFRLVELPSKKLSSKLKYRPFSETTSLSTKL